MYSAHGKQNWEKTKFKSYRAETLSKHFKEYFHNIFKPKTYHSKDNFSFKYSLFGLEERVPVYFLQLLAKRIKKIKKWVLIRKSIKKKERSYRKKSLLYLHECFERLIFVIFLIQTLIITLFKDRLPRRRPKHNIYHIECL